MKFRPFIHLPILAAIVCLCGGVWACGEGSFSNGAAPELGDLAIKISLQRASGDNYYAGIPLGFCSKLPDEVTHVWIEVSGEFPSISKVFPIQEGKGTIKQVPVGKDRKVIARFIDRFTPYDAYVYAIGSRNVPIKAGEVTPVTITADCTLSQADIRFVLPLDYSLYELGIERLTVTVCDEKEPESTMSQNIDLTDSHIAHVPPGLTKRVLVEAWSGSNELLARGMNLDVFLRPNLPFTPLSLNEPSAEIQNEIMLFLAPINTFAQLSENMLAARGNMAIVPLDRSGKEGIMIHGGQAKDGVAGTERFVLNEISTREFSPMSSIYPRFGHTASLLKNGKILIAGGVMADTNGNLSITDKVEIYDPQTATFQKIYRIGSTGSNPEDEIVLNEPRAFHTATVLNDGRVILIGGFKNLQDGVTPYNPTNSAEIYDPDAPGGFEYNPQSEGTSFLRMAYARGGHSATLMEYEEIHDSLVVIAGGASYDGQTPLDSLEFFLPTSNQFVPSPAGGDAQTQEINLGLNRAFHQATLLNAREILLTGGISSSSDEEAKSTGSVEIFNLETRLCRTLLDDNQNPLLMNRRRAYHQATALPDGRILITGGTGGTYQFDAEGPLRAVEMYEPTFNRFIELPDMQNYRTNHAQILLPEHIILVLGGFSLKKKESLNSAEVYNLPGLLHGAELCQQAPWPISY